MAPLKIDNLRASCHDPRWQLAMVFAIVFLSRLPFLDAGYGVNVDGWRVARVARDIATTGEYSLSRFPGYPVQEIICSWFWRGGPFALNALSALFSATAATAFAAIARKLGGRDFFFAALALAATPIFFISSVSSKDYVWAIAFVLLSILSALHQRAVFAGTFLGLATGCRINSLSILLPIALILFVGCGGRERIVSGAKFAAALIVTSMIAFSPVWLRYGTDFWRFYQHARPDWLTIVSRGTVEIWGTIGLLGLVLMVCSALLSRCGAKKKFAASPMGSPSSKILLDSSDCGFVSRSKWITAALVLWIVITVAQYLRLPDQAGYLLPLVPAVLLLAQQLVSHRVFQIACACLVLSPFVDLSRNGVRPGAILADRAERLHTLEQIKRFLSYTETLPGRNTIVVGAWEPIIATVAPNIANGRNHYVYLLDEPALAAVQARHEPIFYAPQMREFNQRIYGIDLARYGGIDLREFSLRQRKNVEQL
jgi:hypothetical protein